MSKDNVVAFESPAGIDDPLSDLLRTGARRLIQQAVEAELAELLNEHSDWVDDQGRRAVVRNGYLPQREILTGVGPVPVKVPKVRSRTGEPVNTNPKCPVFTDSRCPVFSGFASG
jgi:transposase-like protein